MGKWGGFRAGILTKLGSWLSSDFQTMISTKFGFSNNRAIPHVVYVEPWGEDFTLMPGEELEIVAFSRGPAPWFYTVESDEGSQIYCNETDDFKVCQNGRELICGHNRQEKRSP